MIKYSHNVPYFRGITLDSDQIVRKTWISSEKEYALTICKLVSHFIFNPDPKVVPIYDYEYLGPKDHGYQYTYSMMRMGEISREEKAIINDVGDYKRKFRENKEQFYFDYGIDTVKYAKLVQFLSDVVDENRYFDIHCGNIMVDLEENYRLIDLEGFVHPSINHPNNKWFQGECHV